MISIPDNLLKEFDSIVSVEKTNRSKFVREAMKLYIREKRKVEISENMKNGYKEMSQINSTLAEVGFDQDMRELFVYEAKLTGCE